MITYLRVKNVRSIVNAEIDLRFGEGKAPNGYREWTRWVFLSGEAAGERFVPCLALLGSNANGKSNLLRAVLQLQVAVSTSGVDVRKVYDPNQIVTGLDATELVLGFVVGRAEMEYRIVFSGAGMLKEVLMRNGKELYSIHETTSNLEALSTCKPYTLKEVEEIFRVECCDENGRWVRPFLNPIGHRFAGLHPHVKDAFRVIAGGMWAFMGGSEGALLPLALERFSQIAGIGREEALKRVVDVVRKLDVDVKGISFVEREASSNGVYPGGSIIRHDAATSQQTQIFIRSAHVNDRGEQVVFDFMRQESEGTIRLASVVAHFLGALEGGTALFIDELDRSLHPILVRELLRLFQQKTHNTKNAQLIFTTHCTDLLEDEILRLSEVGIVTRNGNAGTKVRRLCELRASGEDIRNVSNFRKRYLEGFYEGIPYPAI